MSRRTVKKVEIKGLDEELRGWFEAEGRRVFISGVAPGDVVDVQIVAQSRHRPVAFGEVQAVEERGPGFVEPPCRHMAPLKGRCGGCPAMHLVGNVADEARLGGVQRSLDGLDVEVTWEGAPARQAYRNRSNFVAARRGGRVILGSYAPRSQDVAEMSDCLVVRRAIAEVHRRSEEVLTSAAVPTGEEAGALRWVSMREASEKVVVELVVRDPLAKWIEPVAEAIFALEPVQGVGVTVNDEATNAVRRAPTKMIRGEGTLVERYGRVDLEIWPGAFAQLNPVVASTMYERAREWAGEAAVVWDLYCGIGGLGLNVAAGRKGAKLWGIESVESAVLAARKNAAAAGVDGRIEVGDLEDIKGLKAMIVPPDLSSPQVILVNPPRKGLSQAVVEQLVGDWRAPRLIYMSCSARSFARDAKALTEAGWELKAVEAHDMLAMTRHVELIALFRST